MQGCIFPQSRFLLVRRRMESYSFPVADTPSSPLSTEEDIPQAMVWLLRCYHLAVGFSTLLSNNFYSRRISEPCSSIHLKREVWIWPLFLSAKCFVWLLRSVTISSWDHREKVENKNLRCEACVKNPWTAIHYDHIQSSSNGNIIISIQTCALWSQGRNKSLVLQPLGSFHQPRQQHIEL